MFMLLGFRTQHIHCPLATGRETPGHPVGDPWPPGRETPPTRAVTGKVCLCLCAFSFPDRLSIGSVFFSPGEVSILVGDRKGTAKKLCDKDFAERSGELSGAICLKILLSLHFPRKRAFLDDFPLCYSYYRLAVSEIWGSSTDLCSLFLTWALLGGGQNLYTNMCEEVPHKHLEGSSVYMIFPSFCPWRQGYWYTPNLLFLACWGTWAFRAENTFGVCFFPSDFLGRGI